MKRRTLLGALLAAPAAALGLLRRSPKPVRVYEFWIPEDEERRDRALGDGRGKPATDATNTRVWEYLWDGDGYRVSRDGGRTWNLITTRNGAGAQFLPDKS